MARTRQQQKARTDAMGDYRQSVGDRCEVTQYLVDVGVKSNWLPNEVNHIEGRGRSESHEWFCNLILVSNAAHSWGHDRSPNEFELACLFAKFEKHWSANVVTDESRMEWNSVAMDRLVKNSNSLAGRISMLMDRVGPGVFWDYGLEMLEVLQ